MNCSPSMSLDLMKKKRTSICRQHCWSIALRHLLLPDTYLLAAYMKWPHLQACWCLFVLVSPPCSSHEATQWRTRAGNLNASKRRLWWLTAWTLLARFLAFPISENKMLSIRWKETNTWVTACIDIPNFPFALFLAAGWDSHMLTYTH